MTSKKLTKREFDILAEMAQSNEELSQRDLARILDVSLGTVNKTVADLSDQGLISGKTITAEGIDALVTSDAWRAFAARRRERPALCEGCRYARFCGGGCPRMKSEVYISTNNEACGYAKFLDACGARLYALAQEAKKRHFGADKKGVKQ